MCRRCPECLTETKAPKTFCSPEHKAAYHNRQTVRGRVLTPLRMASRITRGGTRRDIEIGKQARAQDERLVQRWIEEDRAAGRMAADDYLRQSIALGARL